MIPHADIVIKVSIGQTSFKGHFNLTRQIESRHSPSTPGSSAKKCRTKVTPKRNMSEMPLKQYQYKQSQYWNSQQSEILGSAHRQPQNDGLQDPQTQNMSQTNQGDKDEDVIEIIDDDDDVEDNVVEIPERIPKKKVIQVKVEDESEISALKTLGFRVCS